MNPSFQERQLASYGYFWILSIYVFFTAKREQTFVKAHAEVGMLLSVVTIVGFFLPIALARILVEGLCALGFILGFYRAYTGKVPLWNLNLPNTREKKNTGATVSLPTATTETQEQAFLAYIPFYSLYVVASYDAKSFVHLHGVYALWVQCIALVLAMLWWPLGVAAGVFGLAWGMVRSLQGLSEIIPGAGVLTTKIHSVEDLWGTLVVGVKRILLQDRTYTLQSYRAYIQQCKQTPVWSQPKQWGMVYLIGPLAVLGNISKAAPHVAQWAVLLILLVLAVFLQNIPLVVLISYLWIWILLQIRQNISTVLPGIGRLYQDTVPSSPHTHE